MQIPKFLRRKTVKNRVSRWTFDRAARDGLAPRREPVVTHRVEHRTTEEVGTIPKGTWLTDKAVPSRRERRPMIVDEQDVREVMRPRFLHDWLRTDGKVKRSAERPEGEGWTMQPTGDWERNAKGEPVLHPERDVAVQRVRDVVSTDATTIWGGKPVRLGMGEQPPTKPGARREARGSARQRRRDRRVLAQFPELR